MYKEFSDGWRILLESGDLQWFAVPAPDEEVLFTGGVEIGRVTEVHGGLMALWRAEVRKQPGSRDMVLLGSHSTLSGAKRAVWFVAELLLANPDRWGAGAGTEAEGSPG